MDNNWNIAGHKNQIQFLSNSVKTGKLAHAYLFAGPAHIGKHTVALKFVQNLLCENNSSCNSCNQCKAFIALGNADYMSMDEPEGIKIEQVRDLIYKLSLKPYLAKYKVAVIDDAENMTIEASNALLKSLEEPKSNTILILISSSPDKLPRTILSRVQKISFAPVPESEYLDLLVEKINPNQRDLIAAYAAGRPGLAIRISSDLEFAEKLGSFQTSFETFNGGKLGQRLKLALDIAESETLDIKQTLEYWTGKLRHRLLAQTDRSTASVITCIERSQRLLGQNVNAKLLLFDLMLSTQK